MITTAELERAIANRADELMDGISTPAQVADRLREAGITGIPVDAKRCPLQVWFRIGLEQILEDNGLELVITFEDIEIWLDKEVGPGNEAPLVQVELPELLEDFRCEFDGIPDSYPFLIA